MKLNDRDLFILMIAMTGGGLITYTVIRKYIYPSEGPNWNVYNKLNLMVKEGLFERIDNELLNKLPGKSMSDFCAYYEKGYLFDDVANCLTRGFYITAKGISLIDANNPYRKLSVRKTIDCEIATSTPSKPKRTYIDKNSMLYLYLVASFYLTKRNNTGHGMYWNNENKINYTFDYMLQSDLKAIRSLSHYPYLLITFQLSGEEDQRTIAIDLVTISKQCICPRNKTGLTDWFCMLYYSYSNSAITPKFDHEVSGYTFSKYFKNDLTEIADYIILIVPREVHKNKHLKTSKHVILVESNNAYNVIDHIASGAINLVIKRILFEQETLFKKQEADLKAKNETEEKQRLAQEARDLIQKQKAEALRSKKLEEERLKNPFNRLFGSFINNHIYEIKPH